MTVFEHIKELALNLTPEEKEVFDSRIGRVQWKEGIIEKPQSLRGDWSDDFPKDLDVDGELKEIRGEWKKEWHEDEFVG